MTASVALALRWRRGSPWLIKVQQTPIGVQLLPCSINLFCLFTALFCVLGLVDLAIAFELSSNRHPALRAVHVSILECSGYCCQYAF